MSRDLCVLRISSTGEPATSGGRSTKTFHIVPRPPGGRITLVGECLKEDVRGGALFVFTNKRHTRLKVLYFDGTGLWLMTKRLEQGTFAWPQVPQGAAKVQLRPEALEWLACLYLRQAQADNAREVRHISAWAAALDKKA